MVHAFVDPKIKTLREVSIKLYMSYRQGSKGLQSESEAQQNWNWKDQNFLFLLIPLQLSCLLSVFVNPISTRSQHSCDFDSGSDSITSGNHP